MLINRLGSNSLLDILVFGLPNSGGYLHNEGTRHLRRYRIGRPLIAPMDN